MLGLELHFFGNRAVTIGWWPEILPLSYYKHDPNWPYTLIHRKQRKINFLGIQFPTYYLILHNIYDNNYSV